MPAKRKTVAEADEEQMSGFKSPKLQGVRRPTRSTTAMNKNAALLVIDNPITEITKPKTKKPIAKPKATVPNARPHAEKVAQTATQARTIIVAFEACRSCHRFAKQAREMFAELKEFADSGRIDLELSINGEDADGKRTNVDDEPMSVRRGAFEISVYEKSAGGAAAQQIWTGLKRGPPRKSKYPETRAVYEDILKLYA